MIITMISYFRLSSISLLLSLSLSSSLSLTFSLLFEILPVLFKPQVRCLLWFQSGHKNMVDKEAT